MGGGSVSGLIGEDKLKWYGKGRDNLLSFWFEYIPVLSSIEWS